LPLTRGCSNHSCTFCNYYGQKLSLRDLEDALKEIDALYMFKKYGIVFSEIDSIVYYLASEWDGKRIFLQDGDALVYPYDRLVKVLEYLNEKFPELERIGLCYSSRYIKEECGRIKETERIKAQHIVCRS